jgi:mycothiol system anti-sigma-R factor
MECEEFITQLWEYLDQELEPEEAQAMAEHLGHCPGCRPAYCCNRALLQLLARQRWSCSAPASLVISIQSWLKRS